MIIKTKSQAKAISLNLKKTYVCTIITPTNRPKKFLNLYNSIFNTISNQNKILLIAVVDDDLTQSVLDNGHYTCNNIDVIVHKFENKSGQYGIYDGINSAINKFNNTEWFQITSDDITYTLKNWDLKLKSLNINNNEILRIKSSESRYISIKNPIDCLLYPDCFPYLSSNYLSLTQTAGNCYGSDTFFEAISYFLNDISFNNNPLRQNKICIDVIIDEKFYSQSPFGTDLEDSHQKVSTLLMYIEWFRVLSTSYQNNVLRLSLIIANNILLTDGYKLISTTNQYIQYKKNGNIIYLRKEIRFSEFIIIKYTQLILALMIIKKFSLMALNENYLIKSKNIIYGIKFLIKRLRLQLQHFYRYNILNRALSLSNRFPDNFKSNFVFIKNILLKFKKYLIRRKKNKVNFIYTEKIPMPVSIFLRKHIFGVFIVNFLGKKYHFLRRFKD